MPSNRKTALNGHASPFIPNALRHPQHQHLHHSRHPHPSFLHSSIKQKTPPPPPPKVKLSVEGITRAVSSNNAFLFGQNLLELEKDGSNVGLWHRTVLDVLRLHADPVMFILNVLITIGTVAGYKEVDPDFEYEISEQLVQLLRRLQEGSNDHSSSSHQDEILSSEPQTGGFYFDESFGNPLSPPLSMEEDRKEELDDLIVLDDLEMGILPLSPLQPIKLQRTGSLSLTNLLDDDHDTEKSSTLLQSAVLTPVVANLIDLSNTDRLSGALPLMPSSLPLVTIEGSSACTSIDHAGSTTKDIREANQLQNGSDGKQEINGGNNQAGLEQPRIGTTSILGQRESEQRGCEEPTKIKISSDMQELFQVFNSHLNTATESETLEQNQGSQTQEEETDSIQPGETNLDQQKESNLIQQQHRDKMLGEVVSGKCCLQVFLTIDILELEEGLFGYPKEGGAPTTEKSASYGWMLARQLHERGWFRESSTLVFEYIKPTYRPSSSQDSLSLPLPTSESPPPTKLPSTPGSVSPSGPKAPARVTKSLLSPSTASTLSPPALKSGSALSFYSLPEHIKITMVDTEEKLETLAHSLENSSAVGMDSEWLPMIEKYDKLRPGSRAPRTAILQLACDFDSTVYIVDVVAFLNLNPTLGFETPRIVQVIGGLLNNKQVLKIAFDWDGDRDLLELTYPDFCQEVYRPRNFLDLKYLWFAPRESNGTNANNNVNTQTQISSSKQTIDTDTTTTTTTTTTIQIPKPFKLESLMDAWETSSSSTPSSSSSSPSPSLSPAALIDSSSGNSSNTRETFLEFAFWAMFPAAPNMIRIHGGLTGMLSRLCGYRLNKSQQCSNWELRPLSDKQLQYAAVDAWCLLDIYSVLEAIEQI
ncbi:Exonuclease mut-7 [Mortierella sp. AD011]|nr:Exonuclease mut-7 [Mortierella sp. AD010]KAF9390938.1 Exonuclease mut-7 [Mortierella sp. AD011]